ncbi:RNA ligase family protein [Streptomyces sp. CA-135486]|uniref:RNA ligase family protein n=1 Tax=Streptomyces sp. CA-135486 TaxID=3240049 RepID=UPI003D8EDCEF
MTETFTPAFVAWPKTARLFRDITITEKIDGTNAAIHVDEDGNVAAQSRNRIITPDADNYGFARWVHENADSLHQILGSGLHFGEWWGHGIQRRYGMTEKRFSVFNTSKWTGEMRAGGDGEEHEEPVIRLRGGSISAVPVLYEGTFSEEEITSALLSLKAYGSVAAPGFDNPEGICVYHSQSRNVFKVTLDNYDASKWENA